MLRRLSAALGGLALGLLGRRPAGTVVASHQAGGWDGDVVLIAGGPVRDRAIPAGVVHAGEILWPGRDESPRPVDPAYRLLPNAPVIQPGRAIWPGGRH